MVNFHSQILISDDNLAPDLIANAGPNLTYSDIIKEFISTQFNAKFTTI